jgi:hypothetical protein
MRFITDFESDPCLYIMQHFVVLSLRDFHLHIAIVFDFTAIGLSSPQSNSVRPQCPRATANGSVYSTAFCGSSTKV